MTSASRRTTSLWVRPANPTCASCSASGGTPPASRCMTTLRACPASSSSASPWPWGPPSAPPPRSPGLSPLAARRWCRARPSVLPPRRAAAPCRRAGNSRRRTGPPSPRGPWSPLRTLRHFGLVRCGVTFTDLSHKAETTLTQRVRPCRRPSTARAWSRGRRPSAWSAAWRPTPSSTTTSLRGCGARSGAEANSRHGQQTPQLCRSSRTPSEPSSQKAAGERGRSKQADSPGEPNDRCPSLP
mmetsp:Transcript_120569/g.375396  ORF Transcript_120569/g.375396 Transcript_120569/m.375396 type:complete len:242 (-) Transcript_120569:57-782(-)